MDPQSNHTADDRDDDEGAILWVGGGVLLLVAAVLLLLYGVGAYGGFDPSDRHDLSLGDGAAMADEEGAEATEEPDPTEEPEPTDAPEPSEEPAAATEEPEPTAEPEEPEPTEEPAAAEDAATLAEAADAAGLAGLLAAVEAAGADDLVAALADPDAGPLTVFGPPDAALADVDPAADSTGDVLAFHVVEGALAADDLTDSLELETVQGEVLTVVRDGDEVTLEPGGVAVTDSLTAGNGVLHVVDGLLVPPSIAEAAATTTAINDLLTLEPILFATGSAEILAESQPTLEAAAELLADAERPLTVEGHTDSDGDDALNLTLSQAGPTRW